MASDHDKTTASSDHDIALERAIEGMEYADALEAACVAFHEHMPAINNGR